MLSPVRPAASDIVEMLAAAPGYETYRGFGEHGGIGWPLRQEGSAASPVALWRKTKPPD
jgi:hypothetical protein